MQAFESVSFSWILDRKHDLIFYVGSALGGWLYAGLILLAVHRLDDPLTEALAVISVGGFEIELTLTILVVASWAILLDAPHIWATLARTMLDPDEWRTRGNVLVKSWGWFLLGPAMILLPYIVFAGLGNVETTVSTATLSLGAVTFFVFFRLWAYYHVVRQHWGFFSLYKRKAGDYGQYPARLEWSFFNLTLFVPLVLFMTSEWYGDLPGYPDLGLHASLLGGFSIASVVGPLAWTAYGVILVWYAVHNLQLLKAGKPVNASKLLYMLLIIPLHFVAFSHPIMVFFAVPLVTVGHNIQYHAIVYSYGRSKYSGTSEPRFRWTRVVFRNVGVYVLAGLAFTFLCYRGPWIEWLKGATGIRFDEVALNSLGMMAGIQDPASLGLGEQVVASLFVGWAMQHYYLDSKIWRVSKSREVQKHLKV